MRASIARWSRTMSSKPRSVAVVASSQTPLSPAQRKFNQLVRQIEKLRTELKDWDAAETSFVHNWALQVQPLQIELADCRYGVVLRLRQMMENRGGPARSARHNAKCCACWQLISSTTNTPTKPVRQS